MILIEPVGIETAFQTARRPWKNILIEPVGIETT